MNIMSIEAFVRPISSITTNPSSGKTIIYLNPIQIWFYFFDYAIALEESRNFLEPSICFVLHTKYKFI